MNLFSTLIVVTNTSFNQFVSLELQFQLNYYFCCAGDDKGHVHVWNNKSGAYEGCFKVSKSPVVQVKENFV